MGWPNGRRLGNAAISENPICVFCGRLSLICTEHATIEREGPAQLSGNEHAIVPGFGNLLEGPDRFWEPC